MKTITYYLAILIITSSCAMLKRTSTAIDQERLTSIQDSKKTTDTDLDSLVRKDYLSLNKISDQSSYQIKLWPKGQIVYHSMDSFEGEFDSIRMSGSFQKKSNLATISSNESKLKKEQYTTVTDYAELKTDRKTKVKKSMPDYLAIIVVSVLLFIAAFLVLKYVKKKIRS